jgi:hypothetical protein
LALRFGENRRFERVERWTDKRFSPKRTQKLRKAFDFVGLFG